MNDEERIQKLKEHYIEVVKKDIEDGKKTSISGLNAGTINGDFCLFSDKNNELLKDYDEYVLDVSKMIEDRFFSILLETIDSGNRKFEEENGCLILPEVVLKHKTSPENLSNISKLGILASEWFGTFESEVEGLFCSFVDCLDSDKILNEDVGKYVELILNPDDPIVERMMKEDLWGYAYERKQAIIGTQMLKLIKQGMSKEDIANYVVEHYDDFDESYDLDSDVESKKELLKYYSEDLIEIMEFIMASSPGYKCITPSIAKYLSENEKYYNARWFAFPGGIPPQLISAILIDLNNEEILSQIVEISQLFPDVPIIDKNKRIICKNGIILDTNEKESSNEQPMARK